jgi:hypothetical protein
MMVDGLMLFHFVSIRLTTYDKIGGSPKTVTNAGWQLVALFGDYPRTTTIQKVYKFLSYLGFYKVRVEG